MDLPVPLVRRSREVVRSLYEVEEMYLRYIYLGGGFNLVENASSCSTVMLPVKVDFGSFREIRHWKVRHVSLEEQPQGLLEILIKVSIVREETVESWSVHSWHSRRQDRAGHDHLLSRIWTYKGRECDEEAKS
jgi:hypothetical protein